MKSVRGFALGLAALAVMVLVMTPGGAVAKVADSGATVTVGDFLQSYAKALKIELPAQASGDTVMAALKASGVKLDAGVDPSKALTQGDVVKIGKANGLRLTTNQPEAAFTTEEVDQFFTSYGYTQTMSQSGKEMDVAAGSKRKKKKKKKKKKSPSKMP